MITSCKENIGIELHSHSYMAEEFVGEILDNNEIPCSTTERICLLHNVKGVLQKALE